MRNHLSCPGRFLLIFLLALAPTARAAMITVTSTNDSGAGSLRAAIANSHSGDFITFVPGVAGQTIALSTISDGTFGPSALLVNNTTLTIDGGTNGITITRDANAAPARLRLFYVTSSGNLTLKNLTLSGGLAAGGNSYYGGGAAGLGGAIVNAGTLQLVQATLSSHQARGGSGGIGSTSNFGGGGLGSDAAGPSGGGPNGGSYPNLNGGFGGGGGDYGNAGFAGGFGGGGGGGTALAGGGGFGGGGGSGSGGFGGGGGSAIGGGGGGLGGAVFNYGGTLLVTNSTLAGNTAIGGTGNQSGSGFGGAIFNLNGSVTVLNSTIANNNAPQGGGAIYSLGDSLESTQSGPMLSSATAMVFLQNTILSSSNAVSDYVQSTRGSGSVSSSGGNNVVQTAGNFGGTATTANPLLGPLGNYGGPTRTMPPLLGSPAIDAGNDAAAAGLATDQRGSGFPRVIGAHVDIGAVEGTFNPNIPLGSLSRTNNGPARFVFSNLSGASYTVWAGTNLALPFAQWSNLGVPVENPAGTFTFTDAQATNKPQRYYRVSSP